MKKLIFIFIFSLLVLLPKNSANAYGECSQYGLWASYDYLTDSCKCMSGYYLGTNVLGEPYCKSLSSLCSDELGSMSRWNSLNERCECMSGYVIDKNMFGDDYCVYGETYCHKKYGLYSDYVSYANKCECDSGYTLGDDNKCVKKQNNVYFLLKEINTDSKEAIIKSAYDYSNYYIKYNYGCLSSTIKKYENNNIVVNLGTDYSVDSWDKIVLFDDDETCDIRSVKKVSSSYSLYEEDEEEDSGFQVIYTPNLNTNTKESAVIKPNVSDNLNNSTSKCGDNFVYFNKQCIKIPENAHASDNQKDAWLCNDGYEEKTNSCLKIKDASVTADQINNEEVQNNLEEKNADDKINDVKQDEFKVEKNNSIKTFFSNIFNKIKNWFRK